MATDENSENVGTTRVTRAKAAALTGPNDGAMSKKPLLAKKNAANTLPSKPPAGKKRAALGDLSNVAKGNDLEDVKEAKKPVASKVGLADAAKPQGIMKRTNSTKSILNKDANLVPKRQLSGSGLNGASPKSRKTSSGSSARSVKVQDGIVATESQAPIERNFVQAKIPTAKASTEQAPKVEPQVTASDADLGPDRLGRGALDLDSDDVDDPLMVAEYVHEIFDYLKALEGNTMPNPDYMDFQTELEWKMRGILVDWLIEVHTRFHLLPETLFLAVNIIDRFLSHKVVQLDRLQLVGVTALFIASKYEEVLSPHVTNFRHVADDGFTEAEILSAERFVLSTLNYDLSYPNPMNFLRRISKADGYCMQTRTIGKYLMEISLLDHAFMEHSPSLVAAAAMYTARVVLKKGVWVSALRAATPHTASLADNGVA